MTKIEVVPSEEEQLRPDGQRAGDRDPLLLAARERAHRALGEGRHLHEREEARDGRADLGAGVPAGPKAEGDVLGDAEMGEERVVLEHDADVAPVRRQAGDVAPVERHAAAVGREETGHDPEQRGLAAARGAEQRDELARPHGEVDAAQHGRRAEALLGTRDVQEGGLRHGGGSTGRTR